MVQVGFRVSTPLAVRKGLFSCEFLARLQELCLHGSQCRLSAQATWPCQVHITASGCKGIYICIAFMYMFVCMYIKFQCHSNYSLKNFELNKKKVFYRITNKREKAKKKRQFILLFTSKYSQLSSRCSTQQSHTHTCSLDIPAQDLDGILLVTCHYWLMDFQVRTAMTSSTLTKITYQCH